MFPNRRVMEGGSTAAFLADIVSLTCRSFCRECQMEWVVRPRGEL